MREQDDYAKAIYKNIDANVDIILEEGHFPESARVDVTKLVTERFNIIMEETWRRGTKVTYSENN